MAVYGAATHNRAPWYTHIQELIDSNSLVDVSVVYNKLKLATIPGGREDVYRAIAYPHALRHAPTLIRAVEGKFASSLAADIAAITGEVEIISLAAEQLALRERGGRVRNTPGANDRLDELHARVAYVMQRLPLPDGLPTHEMTTVLITLLGTRPQGEYGNRFRDFDMRRMRQFCDDPRVSYATTKARDIRYDGNDFATYKSFGL